MTEAIKQWIDKQSEVEEIYEPKYGGKDHSGYNTMMLYEVNGERIDAYANGLTKGIEIAEGFAEFLNKGWNSFDGKDRWRQRDMRSNVFTTSQLLEKYLEYLTTLKP